MRCPREQCWRTSGTSAQNLGISGPPSKNRNLPRFTLYGKRTSRNLPETQPSQSLRFAETPSTIPCDILVLGESIELLWKNKLMYPLAVRWHHHRNLSNTLSSSRTLRNPSRDPSGTLGTFHNSKKIPRFQIPFGALQYSTLPQPTPRT